VLGLTKDKEGKPVVLGFEVADITSALNSVIAIQAALLAREKTGEGQFVDISMLDCVVALLHNSVGPYLETGDAPTGNLLHTLPHYGIFETSDGEGLAIGIAHEDWFWNGLCEALGMEECKGLNTIERAMRGQELTPLVAEAVRRRPLEEWMRILTENDVPHAPLATIVEALDDPQVRHRDMVVEIKTQDSSIKQLGSPYKLSQTPPRFEMPPPRLGEHTDELLQEAGFDAAQIAELRESGIVV
jgi:crotonobetainyl-CoA:carnitine CoA-transferase CaiB-like acyl-CoA transferase